MMARAVIGANYGDEGKGLVTDYLANSGGEVVVRFNGGCQAGHTVVTPQGRRHVFSHFGSGAFLGLPTFFSQHCIVNPALMRKELLELQGLGVKDIRLFIHPDCLVTTPWDMNNGQNTEKRRGGNRHGSCGVGIFDTIKRSQFEPIRMRNLWDSQIATRAENVAGYYDEDPGGGNYRNFCLDAQFLADFSYAATISKFRDPIFEGAQGLLLSQDRVWDMPHLTPSYCGMRNVRELCYEAAIDEVEPYYVTRSYMTRHGAGPLENENKKMSFEDNTNKTNPWQGPLRFAPLNWHDLLFRINTDHPNPKLVVTHCDQKGATAGAGDLRFHGPTRHDVEHRATKVA